MSDTSCGNHANRNVLLGGFVPKKIKPRYVSFILLLTPAAQTWKHIVVTRHSERDNGSDKAAPCERAIKGSDLLTVCPCLGGWGVCQQRDSDSTAHEHRAYTPFSKEP